MRLFLSVPLTEEVRTAIAGVQERLKAVDADVRWVEPENFHLTVKFLGDVGDDRLPDIEAACAGIAAVTVPFRITVCGASAFPKPDTIRHPRHSESWKQKPIRTVLMVVREGYADWVQLGARSQYPFAAMGVPREAGIVPHITLGRVRGDRGMDALRERIAVEADTACGEQMVDRIELIQSFLNPTGAVYHNRRSWSFIDTEQKS